MSVMATPNGKACFVKPDIFNFFRTESLNIANIITPNHFEAEYLYGKKINNLNELKEATHCQELKITPIDYKQVTPDYVMLRQIE